MMTSKEIEIYKVCRELPDGRLVSACMKSAGRMEYVIGRGTRPLISCGPLAGFLFLNQAAAFVNACGYPSIPCRVFLARATLSCERFLYVEWGFTSFGGWITNISGCPEGTVLCDSITLLSRVEEDL